MSDRTPIEITLSDDAEKLFLAYQAFTGTPPAAYIEALVEKTLPTLRALVAALEEADGDGDAVMELFGRKMAEAILEREGAAVTG